MDEAFQNLIAAFFRIALGFLKSYRTPFKLKGLRNGSRKRELKSQLYVDFWARVYDYYQSYQN